MVIHPTDRKIRPAAAERIESQQKAEAQTQEAGRSQKAEAAGAAPRTVERDSFTSARTQEGAAAARNAVDPADQGVAIKEQRRSRRAASDPRSQLIGDAPAPAATARPEVISPSSPAGQAAIQSSLEHLKQRPQQGVPGGAPVDPSKELVPRSIERDELGMTHVRMDRRHENVPVFGEQVVTHLDRDGKVTGVTGELSPIPGDLCNRPLQVSKEQALQMAAREFAGQTDRAPTAERVLVKGPNGDYHSAWRVEMTNTTNLRAQERPRRMNYLIDTQSGRLLEKFNQIGGVEIPAKRPAQPLTVEGTTSPNAPIKDQGSVVSSLRLDQDVDIQKLKLNLDIDHTYKGDLRVTLTSPSGKSAVVHNRTGGGTDNVKGDFDLTAFAGESSKGEWKLTVEDLAARDTGTLNKWGLSIEGTPKTPPPGGVDTVTKTTAPNAPIRDNTTITSTIDVPESFDIDKFKLDLDIGHTYRGDLKVTLTSPSGKSAVVHDRAGGSADDLKGPFDLSTSFAGEKVQGQWKLTVEDRAAQDTGTLRSWGFTATAKTGNPPPPPPGQADDTSLYSGKVQLDTTRNADGTYRLEDTGRGKGVATYDARGSQRPTTQVNINDNNNVWGEAGDPAANRAAVDAHYGTQTTYDFYKNVLGRDSIDGQGEKLSSFVHVGQNYVNAFWDGEKMNYGDGDGRTAGPLTTLDIAGHEISHGLTERTAGLIYSGESGGLNEAMSDIMGTGVEWYASQKNQAVKFDWSVGEDAWTPQNGDPTDALRYMNDPKKDNYSIDHYSEYPRQTEVHGSSGIANNAFYLLANGGTNRTSGQTVQDGIGMEKSLKVYYRALAYYMTPRTNFAGAREATIKAATDLYGANSAEAQRVAQSWDAVGVR